MENENENQNSTTNPLCAQIETLLQSQSYTVVQLVQLLLLAITLCSTVSLVRIYNRHRVHMHGNLLLLFANIVAIYTLHSLGQFACIFRYRVLMLLYKDPCELLTPVWMVTLFYGPTYVYYVAYPTFHFCVMLERVRATCQADRYEREGHRLGILMFLANWFLSLAFLAFVIGSALADADLFSQPQGIIFLTSRYNNQPIFYVSIATLALVVLTALCDWRVTVLNTRIRVQSQKKDGAVTYSLSRNFQLNENVLAMRLIWPLDTAYALLYALYTLIVILLRAYRSSLGIQEFVYFYNLTNTLLFLYSAVTMLVYIRFVKFVSQCQRRDVSRRKGSEPEAKIHFKQLEALWA